MENTWPFKIIRCDIPSRLPDSFTCVLQLIFKILEVRMMRSKVSRHNPSFKLVGFISGNSRRGLIRSSRVLGEKGVKAGLFQLKN